MLGAVFALSGVASAKTTVERVLSGDYLSPTVMVAVGGTFSHTTRGVVQAVSAGLFTGGLLLLPGSAVASTVDRWTGSRRIAFLSGLGVTAYWVNFLHRRFL